MAYCVYLRARYSDYYFYYESFWEVSYSKEMKDDIVYSKGWDSMEVDRFFETKKDVYCFVVAEIRRQKPYSSEAREGVFLPQKEVIKMIRKLRKELKALP